MATHSSILARRIPRTEEPRGLQSTGSQSRTRLSNFTHTHIHTHTHTHTHTQRAQPQNPPSSYTSASEVGAEGNRPLSWRRCTLARVGGPESLGGNEGTAWVPPCHIPPPSQVKAIFLIMASCPGVTLTHPVSTAKAGLRRKRKGCGPDTLHPLAPPAGLGSGGGWQELVWKELKKKYS